MNDRHAVVRVGIVDDHPAILLGVTALLNAREDIQVVASAASVTDLLARHQAIDVVLLDLSLADGSTPESNVRTLDELRAHVIAFTSGDRPDLIRRAARAGIAGMMRKTERPDTLAEMVRAAHAGQIVATTDWADALASDTALVDASLTRREAEVLALYAAGETAAQVAARLFLSRETVTDHIQRIRSKYANVDRHAPTKVDLFRRAIEDGIIDDQG